MGKKEITILADQVDNCFLPFVRKPGRYIGGEINQVKKQLDKCELNFALCFPDAYEVGMSYSGLGVLYNCLNQLDAVAAERVFAPWNDAEKVLRQKGIPLFSLESRASLKSFDVVGFSLTAELCYSNVLNMIDLGGMKIRSADRDENDPVIIAGGGMANCCEPVADFIDLFILGEAEETIAQFAEFVRQAKKAGLAKKDILLKAARQFEWAYVPALYEFDKKKGLLEPIHPDVPLRIKSAVVEDFENAPVPLAPLVPFTQAVHERVSVEIMRGCPGRCRFCQASFCRRPIRYKSIDKIVEIAKECYKATGFDTVSLLSLSTADYPNLEQLTSQLHEYFCDKHVGLSLPSLRVDQQLKLLPKLVTSVRKGGLTIAVEAASEKVRQVVNKPLKDKDLFAAVEAAYRAGWQRLKLYFMVGLPSETEEDIKCIADLSYRLATLRRQVDGKTANINVAVSWFVPKPHTPFGWLGQRPASYFENAKQLILDEKKRLRAKFLQFKFHGVENSVLESAIARGDRRLCGIIENAWRAGARFDLWGECFNYQIWQKAFDKSGIDLEASAQRQFATDEILPWEHLGGPDKKYLLDHLNQSISE